ncbi:MAG TPA: tRNA lysidine(34) synthetase TilS [Kofleriaceae bacterium]
MGITDKTDVVRIVRDAVNSAIGPVDVPTEGPIEGNIGVACSGGIDSMALADAAIAVLGERVVIVTIDHQLQAASAEVARSVAGWASGQGVEAVVRQVVVGGTSEAAAREARYAAFEEVMQEKQLAAMLIAHTQRDQAETVLMRIVRGTGPAGLAGIAAVRMMDRGCLVRPLLGVTREQTEAYVEARGLPHWDDPMNRDTTFTRVRIREEMLPELRELNPNVDLALVRLADSTREWLEALDAIAEPLARFPIGCEALARHPTAIRKRAVAIALDRGGIDFDASHLEAIDGLIVRPAAGEVALDLPAARFVRRYDLAMVEPVSRPEPPRISSLVAPPGYELRSPEPGERFRPIRLNGRSKKLSDLYIDMKLPRDERARARVMVRLSDRSIVWAEHLGIAHGEASDLAPLPGRTDGRF